MLTAKGLNVGYGSNTVFPAISFSAMPGDVIALLGVNGIGKSTLLRTVAGLQKKLSGDFKIDGKTIEELTASARARLISIVLTERVFIDNISVKEFIALGRSPYTDWLGKLSEQDEQTISSIISLMKIEKLQNRLFNQLSDGEKQKTLIARALCQETPVIILDEPTAFLDFRNKKEILELLQSISATLNKVIIFSTHDIDAALEHCNKCWIMTEEKQFTEVTKSPNFKSDVMQLLAPSSVV